MKAGITSIALMAMMTMASCVHREFDFGDSQYSYLDVVFDWSLEPDANPKSMSLYLFSREGGDPRSDLTSRDATAAQYV